MALTPLDLKKRDPRKIFVGQKAWSPVWLKPCKGLIENDSAIKESYAELQTSLKNAGAPVVPFTNMV